MIPLWRNLVWVFLSLIIYLAPQFLKSQTKIISGNIRDSKSGEPLSYATIQIKGTYKGTISNVDGYFTLLGLNHDTLTVISKYLGYQSQETFIDINNSNSISIEMLPVISELEGVTIYAESFQIMKANDGLSSVRLSPEHLNLLPSIGEVDIFRSLQLLPGVSATNENSSGLYIRGGTPDQNLVLLDGMTVYHVDHFFGFFSAFNADAIKDVKLYKGAFPAKYGERISGVVDLTGKTGDVNNFNLDAGINLLSARVLVEIPLWGKGSILFAGRRSYTDILESGIYTKIFDVLTQGNDANNINTNTNQNGPNPNVQIDDFQPTSFFYDLNAKVTLRPTPKDNLSISLYNGEDFLDESREINRELNPPRGQNQNQNQFARRAEVNILDETSWGNQGVSFKWSRQWSPRFFSNAMVAHSTYFSDFERIASFDLFNADADTLLLSRNISAIEKNRIKDYTVRIDQEWQISNNHKIDFGLHGKQYEVDYNFVRNDTITILNREQQSREGSFFIQDRWAVIPDLELTLGVRSVYYDETEEFFLEPRISFSYRISDLIKIKGGYGQYHQFVNRIINENVTEGSRDFWLLSDGNVLDVNSSTHYVIGTSYENANWLLDVEFYRKETQGLSEFSLRFQRNLDDDVSQLFFRGSGIANGVDILLQKKIGNYTGWAGYSISRIEHTFPDLNDGIPFPALHDQAHEISLVNTYKWRKWNFAATWIYGSGHPFTQPESTFDIELLDERELSYIHVGLKNGERLPAYHRLDLSARYNFRLGKSKGDFGLSLFNLYNHKNIWYKEFDVSESPILITDINYLGLTPNLSLNIQIK